MEKWYGPSVREFHYYDRVDPCAHTGFSRRRAIIRPTTGLAFSWMRGLQKGLTKDDIVRAAPLCDTYKSAATGPLYTCTLVDFLSGRLTCRKSHVEVLIFYCGGGAHG